MNATYDNGVLRMTIPVSEAAQPRRIEVQGGAGQQSLPVGEQARTGAAGSEAERQPVSVGAGGAGEQAQASSSEGSTTRGSSARGSTDKRS